ncbi:MAG: VWA domain-containing protein [Myxococcales bacterium]|nr:VWA domain-containing protein [Myxococcales bacterium]
MRARTIPWGALLLAACATSTAYDLQPSPPPGDPIAVDTVMGELPPHHFTPREHVARTAPTPMAAPLQSLPAMVRSSKCVAAGAVAEGRAGASARRKGSSAGHSPGFVPYAKTPSPKDADGGGAAPVATPPAGASGDASLDDDAAFASTVEVASEAESSGADRIDAEPAGAPPDRGESTIATSSRSERRAQRSRRKAERAHERALAQAPTTPSSPATAVASEEPAFRIEPEILEPEWPPAEEGWGAATYLSNDDSMSLSSAQRVLFAIDQHLPLPPEHVRPHELLNYFSFATAPVEPGHDFSVLGEIAPSRREPGLLGLGLAIAGRPVGREGRRNAVLTLVVDRSGSMKAEGRMEYLKRGLLRMVRELKDGDVVNVVTFDQRVCTPLRNFVVGRDDLSALTQTIHGIRPSGATNLHAGLTRGYELADDGYQPGYTNRVLLVSDAIANQGVTDPRTLAMVSDWYDARRIRLSGIGVGREFNDALLDRLTEKGRGAYVFLGSEAEVDAVFGPRFSSLVETVGNDLHFRLHLPPSLRMEQFHGEEASTRKAEVQAVHFFADTSQLMLAELEPWQGQLRPQDELMLEIEYQDPETGELRVEDHVLSLAEISRSSNNLRKAEVVMAFVDGIGRQARRGAPAGWRPEPGAWRDPTALEDCADTRSELRELAAGSSDPEIARILSLWDGYCERFEGAAGARPGRKGTGDRWPGAAR